jgi:hypothetical protein
MADNTVQGPSNTAATTTPRDQPLTQSLVDQMKSDNVAAADMTASKQTPFEKLKGFIQKWNDFSAKLSQLNHDAINNIK